MRPLARALCLIGLASVLVSCGGRRAEKVDFAIEKSYERGPVSVAVKVSDKEITIADELTLALEVSAEEGYEVEFPGVVEELDKLGQFLVADSRRREPRLAEGGRVLTARSYVLHPTVSGDYTIPRLTFTFWQKGKEKSPEAKHKLATEKLSVKVTSIRPEDEAELTIKEIAGPVALPRPRRGWLVVAVAGGGVGLVGLAVVVVWVRRRRRRPESATPTMAAHELAYRRLEALLGEDLLGKGEIKAFYRGVSDVLRHYIEDRFGLHAPERTTEEFLDELRTSEALGAEFQPLLGEFLSHCDLVKFAEHRPANEQIQQTFDACKNFIEATRAEDARIAVATAAA